MYIVLEIQTNADGTIGSLITQHTALNDAESKYHEVLRYAAISRLPVHAAVLLNNEGMLIRSERYIHEQEAETNEE